MPKRHGITHRFLSEIAGRHTEKYIRVLFSRRGWGVGNAEDVRKYLEKFLGN